MSEKDLRKVSKSLSYVLRHRPDTVRLESGEGGWVAVDELLAAFQSAGKTISSELLDVAVLGSAFFAMLLLPCFCDALY